MNPLRYWQTHDIKNTANVSVENKSAGLGKIDHKWLTQKKENLHTQTEFILLVVA